MKESALGVNLDSAHLDNSTLVRFSFEVLVRFLAVLIVRSSWHRFPLLYSSSVFMPPRASLPTVQQNLAAVSILMRL